MGLEMQDLLGACGEQQHPCLLHSTSPENDVNYSFSAQFMDVTQKLCESDYDCREFLIHYCSEIGFH